MSARGRRCVNDRIKQSGSIRKTPEALGATEGTRIAVRFLHEGTGQPLVLPIAVR